MHKNLSTDTAFSRAADLLEEAAKTDKPPEVAESLVRIADRWIKLADRLAEHTR